MSGFGFGFFSGVRSRGGDSFLHVVAFRRGLKASFYEEVNFL